MTGPSTLFNPKDPSGHSLQMSQNEEPRSRSRKEARLLRCEDESVPSMFQLPFSIWGVTNARDGKQRLFLVRVIYRYHPDIADQGNRELSKYSISPVVMRNLNLHQTRGTEGQT